MIRNLAVAILAVSTALPAWAQSTGTDPNLARNMASNCANCHGTNGRGVAPMASLAGMPRDAIARQMREFRDGKRPATIMHQLAKGYSEEQIDLIASYFAAQKAQ